MCRWGRCGVPSYRQASERFVPEDIPPTRAELHEVSEPTPTLSFMREISASSTRLWTGVACAPRILRMSDRVSVKSRGVAGLERAMTSARRDEQLRAAGGTGQATLWDDGVSKHLSRGAARRLRAHRWHRLAGLRSAHGTTKSTHPQSHSQQLVDHLRVEAALLEIVASTARTSVDRVDDHLPSRCRVVLLATAPNAPNLTAPR